MCLAGKLGFENRSEKESIGKNERQKNAENIHEQELPVKLLFTQKIDYAFFVFVCHSEKNNSFF